MQRTVTGRYESRRAADEAREALVSIGVPEAGIKIIEPVRDAGMFDRLASALSPDRAGDTKGEGYRLVAEVPAERTQQAVLVLGQSATCSSAAAGPREQIFELSEYREELRVERQPFVSEEVVLRKQAGEHVAQIQGTLRRTEVEIEEIAPADAAPAAEPRPDEPLRFGLRTRPE